MSRIIDVSVSRVRLRFREPVRHGRAVLTTQEVGILRLATEDGLVGLGEVSGPVLPPDLEATLARVANGAVGGDPETLDDPHAEILAGALDTALLDIRGRLRGRSLADLLGGGSANVRVNGLMTVGVGTPDAAAVMAMALVARGFRTIKIKRALDSADPLVHASLRAVRDAVGTDVALRLDLNGDLSERAAVDWLTSLERLALEYVEQPIAPWLGAAAMVRVRAAIPMPLAADESVVDLAAAVTLMDAGACDVLVVKPSRVGGPRASVRIARAAATAGVAVTISTLYDSGIGLAAALHAASTVPGDRAHGLGTAALLESDLIGGVLPIVDGRMALPMGAGLGVTLDPMALSDAMVQA